MKGWMKLVMAIALTGMALTPAGAAELREGKMVTSASGLKYLDLVVGKGDSPVKGQPVTVHYTGTLETVKNLTVPWIAAGPLPLSSALAR